MLRRVVVEVRLGVAHSNFFSHMPHSPTKVVQQVAALGCAVCGCWIKRHVSNWGGVRGFRAVFGAVVVVALLLWVQGAVNWSCVVPRYIKYT